jgi:hypothetical protein
MGWPAFFAARGTEVTEDDLGRPSVPREVLGELLRERREREAEQAALQSELDELVAFKVPAGVPAQEGSTPFESMVAGDPHYQSVHDEFAGRPKPAFLEEELARGRQHQLAEAEVARRRKEKAKQ